MQLQSTYLLLMFQKYYLSRFIHLMFCIAGLIYFTYTSAAIIPDWLYIAVISAGTWVYYNLHRIITTAKRAGDKISWKDPSVLLYLVLLILLFLISVLHFMDIHYFFWISFASLVSLFYLYPIHSEKLTLRNVPYIKTGLIALVFTIVTLVIPLWGKGFEIVEILLLAISRLFFISTLCLIFDIGDIQDDRTKGLKTFPLTLGPVRTVFLALFLLILTFLIEAYSTYNFTIDVKGMFALTVTYGVTAFLVLKANPSRSDVYFLFFTDGMMLLPAILYTILAYS
jgi:4-hydroxybenzoate polyprenyltransferase